MKTLSIVIVNWNTSELLRECIESILIYDTSIDYEIIVVDNASSDDSVQMINQYYPEIKLMILQENIGFAGGNNVAITQSSAKYVALVNSDVKFIEDTFTPLIAFLEANLSIAIVGPKLVWEDLTLQLSCRHFPSIWNNLCSALGLPGLFPKSRFFSGEHMNFFDHETITDVDALVGAFLLLRRSDIEEVGLLDESFFMYCEEIDWCKRFNLLEKRISFFSDAKVIHYGGGSSNKEPERFIREYCLSNFRYWDKHHSKLSSLIFRLIFLLKYFLRLPIRFLAFVFCKPFYSKKRYDSNTASLRAILVALRVFFKLE